MTTTVASSELVGRRAELGQITDCLTALASRGSGGVMLIAGEAGVGKSRLIDALTDTADGLDLPVFVGRCVQFGEMVLPAAPLVDILGELAERLDPEVRDRVLGPAEQELGALIPALSSASSPTALKAERLFEIVHDVLRRLSEQGPVVLVVEDLHWADRTTRDLVGFLTYRLSGAPMLLAATYRSDDLHRRHPLLPMLAELQRAVRPERIDLAPFDVETTATLVAAIGHEPSPTTVESLHLRSGGNPFYIEELLAAAESERSVPATLRDIVLSRSRGLDENALAVLRVASALGSHFDEAILGLVADLKTAAVNDALHQLVDGHFLVSEGRSFRFRHDLTCEVFADELLPGERAELHRRIAEVVQDAAPQRYGEIARHWFLSGDQPQSLRSAIVAGEAASKSGATAEALLHFERALELWGRVPPEDRHTSLSRSDLLFLAAEAAHGLQEFQRGNSLAQEACDELAAADNITRANALRRQGRWLWDSGEPGLDQLINVALELVASEPACVEVADVLAWAAGFKMMGDTIPESMEFAESALEMARAIGATRTEANALNTLAINRYTLGHPNAVADMQAALELAIQSGDTREVSRAYINLSEILVLSGRYEEAIALVVEGQRYGADHGYRSVCGAMLAENASHGLRALGRWDRMAEIADQVLAHRRLDLAVPAPTGLSAIAQVMVKQGETDRARPLLEHDFDTELSGYYCGTTCVVLCGLIELSLVEGQTKPDRALVERGVELLSATSDRRLVDVMALALRSEADHAVAAGYVGDDSAVADARAAADGWLDLAERRSRERCESPRDPDFDPQVALCRAEHARAQGTATPEDWASVVASWGQLERPWDVAYAKWRHAESVLLTTSRLSTERTFVEGLLRDAAAATTELGAKPLLADIESLAARARIDLSDRASESPIPAEAQSVPFDLTPRELEVLELVAEGYSNGRIGQELFISTKTASVHVSNILRKLGAANRVEAAAIAVRARVVNPGDREGAADVSAETSGRAISS